MKLKQWLSRLTHKKPVAIRRRRTRTESQDHPCAGVAEFLEDRTLLATFSVLNIDDSGVGSLRQAVVDANSAPGADIVQFDLPAGPQTILLGSPLPAITASTSLNGPGADQLTVSGGGTSRVFEFGGVGTNTYTVTGITIAEGNAGTFGVGGGVLVQDPDDTLILDRVWFRDNVSNDGGGLHITGGQSVISNSAFTGNTTTFVGSAISVQNSNVTLENVTISSSGGGVGVRNFAADGETSVLRILHSTIAGNTGPRAVENSSIGTGVSDLMIGHSILADNSTDNFGNFGVNSTTLSLSYNISDDDTAPLTAAGDLTETDPLLDALADTGGPTPTYALLSGSPAIDAGDPAFDASALPTDQRGPGFDRLLDSDGDGTATVDIGAWESPVPTDNEDRVTPTIDIDGDGKFTPLGDGITAIRFLAGFTGQSLVAGTVNPDGRRTDPVEIIQFLESEVMQALLDIDGNQRIEPLSDGILLIRGLAGFTDTALTDGAVDPLGTRTLPKHVEFHINQTATINDAAEVNEGEVLTVSADDGVLQNDAPGSTIVSFETTSQLGATVQVFDDGSYTYDPTGSATLNQLSSTEIAADSFNYVVESNGTTQQVTVGISVWIQI